MVKIIYFILGCMIIAPILVHGTLNQKNNKRRIQIAIVKNKYKGDRRGSEISNAPEILEKSGLKEKIQKLDIEIKQTADVKLTEILSAK